MGRKALLLGIDAYVDDALKLPAAKNDIAELGRVLEENLAYEHVRRLSTADTLLTTYGLEDCIPEFFQAAEAEDDLWLYISGHGVEQDGRRVVIPQDYRLAKPRPARDFVGDQELFNWARGSPARSVVIVVDACREGVKLVLAPDPAMPKALPLTSSLNGAGAPTIAILYSCGSKERSWAEGGPQGRSYFTRALCEVLRQTDHATLSAIHTATQGKLNELLESARIRGQTITFDERLIGGRAGPPLELIVRENAAARLRQQLAASQWCEVFRSSRLWQLVLASSLQLAQRIEVVGMRAESLVNAAQQKLPNDRWRNPGGLKVILQRLETLLGEELRALSPAEAALALLTPAIYEAILAAGALLLAKDGNPLTPLADMSGRAVGRAWSTWRSDYLSEELLGRRVALLQKRGLPEAADDLVAWLMNRFLHSSGELWDYVPAAAHDAGGWINEKLHQLLSTDVLATGSDERVQQVLDGQRLVQLARLMFAGLDDIEALKNAGGGHRLREDVRFGEGAGEWRLNEVQLAYLMSVAAAMAADARRLDATLAEHIGMSGEMTASELRKTLATITWHWKQDDLVLRLASCPHEVLDLAIEQLSASLEEARNRADATGLMDDRFRSVLPQHFTDSTEPVRDGRTPRYQRPHLRLTLDHRRVMQVLMGTALYGKPELALRELYQNAMDACRLRQARVRYLRAMRLDVAEYRGKIRFQVGMDAGRAFVECEDNGIGMSAKHLSAYFARAGRRFTDSHEFHVERAAWNEQGIAFYPNSRFGIGVFSYFMLADEVVIHSRRLLLNGVDCEPGVQAHIVGGSSLFRVQPAAHLHAGTRVRLYLIDERGADGILNKMLQWLWLPEFVVELIHQDSTREVLPAGSPTSSFTKACGAVVPIAASCDQNGHPRLFWPELADSDRRERSSLLADGIRTENASGISIPLIVNLNGELRPEITVDRSRLTAWMDGLEYAVASLRAGGWQEVLKIPKLTLRDLGRAFHRWPLPLLLLDKAWRSKVPDLLQGKGASASSGKRLCDEISHLMSTALGVAPVIDDWLCESFSRVRSDRRSWDAFPEVPNRSRSAQHFARWVAARARALYQASVLDSEPLRMLALYAELKGWSDRPTLGLILLSRDFDAHGPWRFSLSTIHVLRAASAWSMTVREIAEIAQPLLDLGIRLTGLDRLPLDLVLTASQRRMLAQMRYIPSVEEDSLTPAHFARITEALGVSMNEVAATLRPLADLGIRMPDISTLANLPTLTSDHRRLADLLDVPRASGMVKWLRVAAHYDSGPDGVAGLANDLQLHGMLASDVAPLALEAALKSFGSRGQYSGSISLEVVVEVAARNQKTSTDVAGAIRYLALEGFEVPGVGRVETGVAISARHVRLAQLTRAASSVGIGVAVRVAAEYGCSLGEVGDAAQLLTELGGQSLMLPHAVRDFVPTAAHLFFMPEEFLQGQADQMVIPVARVVAAALEWQLSFAQVAEIARPLSALGLRLPALDHLPSTLLTDTAAACLLSSRLDAAAPWLDAIPTGHAISALSTLGAEVARVCQDFNRLGIPAPSVAVLQATDRSELTSSLLSQELNGTAPWRISLDTQAVLRVACKWRLPIGEVTERARKSGLLIVGAAPDAAAAALVPTDRHLLLLTEDLRDGSRDLTNSTLALGHLFSAAVKWSMTFAQVEDMARSLERLGVIRVQEFALDQRGIAPDSRHVTLLSSNLNGMAPWVSELNLEHLWNAATYLGLSFLDVLELATPLRSFGRTVPAIPEPLSKTYRHVREILEYLSREQQKELHAYDVAAVAYRMNVDIAELNASLDTLATFGIEVSEARDFVRFSIEQSQRESQRIAARQDLAFSPSSAAPAIAALHSNG